MHLCLHQNSKHLTKSWDMVLCVFSYKVKLFPLFFYVGLLDILFEPSSLLLSPIITLQSSIEAKSFIVNHLLQNLKHDLTVFLECINLIATLLKLMFLFFIKNGHFTQNNYEFQWTTESLKFANIWLKFQHKFPVK